MKTKSKPPEHVTHAEPDLVLAAKVWKAYSQPGSVQPPLENPLEDQILDFSEFMRAINWCATFERLPLLLEILVTTEKTLHRYAKRHDLTFSEILRLHKRASDELQSIMERLERERT